MSHSSQTSPCFPLATRQTHAQASIPPIIAQLQPLDTIFALDTVRKTAVWSSQ